MINGLIKKACSKKYIYNNTFYPSASSTPRAPIQPKIFKLQKLLINRGEKYGQKNNEK